MEFYDLLIKNPAGEQISMESFRGKVVLIVNTATKCGLAPQFKELERLHKTYEDQGLVILGFPSNQFQNQEPESNETMIESCQVNFGVTFQLSEKIDVNGKHTHPVFRYLKDQLPGSPGNRIKWNFTKFLIDSQGNPYKRFAPVTKPESIEPHIKKLLKSVTSPQMV
jgi:glutathione peroxidase